MATPEPVVYFTPLEGVKNAGRRVKLPYAPEDSVEKARSAFIEGRCDFLIAHDPGDNLLGCIVLALMDMGVLVDGLHADQWFGVSARSAESAWWVECDDPMQGIAALWLYLLNEAKDGDLGGS